MNDSVRNDKEPARINPFQVGPGHWWNLPVKVKPKDAKRTIRRMWDYLKRQRGGLLLVLFSTAVSSVLTLVGPLLLGHAVDEFVLRHDAPGLLRISGALLAVYGAASLTLWIQQYVVVGVSQKTVKAMRHDLFVKFQGLPLRFFDTRSHGDLMSRTTNDITNVSNTLNQSVTQLISSVFLLVGSLVMMTAVSRWMTAVTVVTVPLIAFVVKRVTGYTRRYFSAQQRELGVVNGIIQETISGQRVVKVFGREEKAKAEFNVANNRLRKVAVKAQSVSGSMGPLMNAMRNLNFTIIAFAGGWFAFHDMITVGVIVSFLGYSQQFSQPINQLANQYNMVQSAVAGAERVFEVMDEPLEQELSQAPVEGLIELDRVRGDVTLNDVSFSYTGEVPVLRNITLHAKPGETVALVGPTGAGKTTIVNVLSRFYEIDGGSICIDGQDLRGIDRESLRRKLGIVLQDAYLFSDTIRENIRFGRLDATDAEVEYAATLANADSFIRKFPGGYDTLLSAEGANLSHGQRQLLTIARAVLADPSILILDEATSSVDTRTEVHIQAAMHALMKGRTSFVIAHRLSTIRNADQILVIDDGQIVERGSHEELLACRGVYYSMYSSQLTAGMA